MVEVLSSSHFAYLCTTDQNNQPHITPMFFVFHEESKDLFVVTSLKSKKMKNIRMNPKVSLTVDVRDPENPFNNRGVMVLGQAVVGKTVDSLSSTEDKKLVKAYKRFREKYPTLKEAQPKVLAEYLPTSEALIRIVANKMVYWRGPHFITVNLNRRSHIN